MAITTLTKTREQPRADIPEPPVAHNAEDGSEVLSVSANSPDVRPRVKRKPCHYDGHGSSTPASGQVTPRKEPIESQGPPDGSPCSMKENQGWRRIIRNFTPSWFAVNMGTGIVSILIHNLPYNAAWLQCISYVFFALNLLLFAVFAAISFLRYTLYPEIWTVMVRHPTQSLFLGCFPMALATLINMLVFSCAAWGAWPIYLAFSLWCLDVVLSVLCCVLILFPMMHHHKLQTQHVTGAMLLPFVPCVVASASGGIVASALLDDVARPDLALVALLASYVIWGFGLSFSAIVLALYFQRLCLHALPPREAIVSVFLPIGPLGQGGFGIQQLGRVALAIFPATGVFDAVALDATVAGQVFYALGIILALLMWGAGLAWLLFAAVTMFRIRRFPFNMGWWGFTFPLGVFTTCTGMLAEEFDSTFFKVLTMVFSLAVLVLWVLVAARTLKRAVSGEIVYAPCLDNLPAKQKENDADEGVVV